MQIVFIIGFLLLLMYSVLIMYYRRSWIALANFKLPASNPVTTISIIIPARNEAQNIKICLDSIVSQCYPKNLFEVLVVDDFSTDATAAIVQQYATQNVKLISLKDFITSGEINSYKKKAIEIAIQQSSGELILTTDADCVVTEKWLQNIAAFYLDKKPNFIAMPVGIRLSANSKTPQGNTPQGMFLQIFQSLDFMTLQGITGASVHQHIHSMCNGANLAYTKAAFTTVNGFKGIDTIASGDDMLLMHKIYKLDPQKVFFLKSTDVVVQTQPVSTIKDFFNQRIRWASKADKYDDKRIFAVLLLVYFFNVLLVALPLISIFTNPAVTVHIYPVTITTSLFEFWLFLIISKTIVELIFLFPVARFFKQTKLLWWFPLMQPFHILYTIIAGWLGKFGSYQWKDRNVK